MRTLKTFFYLSLVILFFYNCQTDEDSAPRLATIVSSTTNNSADITFTSLKINGEITSDGGSTITSKGVCWSTTTNPTIEDNITVENENSFISIIENLTTNTTYYFRLYAINEAGVSYGDQLSLSTLSLENTIWEITTYYYQIDDYAIYAEVNFYDDQTTKFDELDLPGQCPGCFITYGTWSLNGNDLTYIWEGNNANNSTYVYTGTLNGMSIEGTFLHTPATSAQNGVWFATQQ